MSNRERAIIRRLLLRLSKRYKLKVGLRFIRRGKRSRMEQHGDSFTLTIAEKGVDEYMRNGFLEYKSLRDILPKYYFGLNAIERLVVHEFCHALTASCGHSVSMHDKWYKQVYIDLLAAEA
jgi:hypothetical protein